MHLTRKTWAKIFVCGLLSALTLVTFWPILHHEFIGYDDPVYVTENPHVQAGLHWKNITWAFETGTAANWHPVTWLSHMLDAQLFGMRPGGHHLASLLLHMTNTVLLFLLLEGLTGALWRSALVAALFGVHPLHVESAAWVAERKDLLSTLFFLLTLAAYAVYAARRPLKKGPNVQQRSWLSCQVCYVLSLIFFALGLMSKPMLVTLPFVLLLLDFWPLKREQQLSQPKGFSQLLAEKLPFLLLAVVSSIITLHVQSRGGAVSSMSEFPLPGRLANALASYVKYLSKAFWPTNLTFFYPHPANPHSKLAPWPEWALAAALLLLIGISALAVCRRQREPWLLTGWFWYLGTLVPVVGIVQAGSQAMADRYTYIPLIGFFLCVSWLLAEIAVRHPKTNLLAAALAGVLVFACASVARRQVGFWKNDFTLCEHALQLNERNAPAHAMLGSAYGRKGQYELSRNHCLAAIDADPFYAASWHTLGDADDALGKPLEAVHDYESALRLNPSFVQSRFRLGYVYSKMGKSKEAATNYEAALQVDPNFMPAHNNLAVVYWSLGRRKEALEQFTETVRLAPQALDKRLNLGKALAEAGELPEAARQLNEAVRLKPDSIEALNALGGVLVRQNKLLEAEACFRQMVLLRPNDPELLVRLGGALLTGGKTNQAATCFTDALRLEPGLEKKLLEAGKTQIAQGRLEDALASFTCASWLNSNNPETQERLGLLLVQRGQFDDAILHFEEALRLAPTPGGYYNLGLALSRQGKLKEAVPKYQQALKLKPDSPAALNDLAWIFATAPQAELRNGEEAVRLAERACQLTGNKNPHLLGTLDAAYAETGRFDDALRTADQVRNLAVALDDKSLAEGAEKRAALYKRKEPFRQ